MNTFIDDNDYSNFSIVKKLREQREKKAKDKADADAKAKADTDAKLKADADAKAKADAEKQPQVDATTPKKSNKLPLIIGGFVVLGIGIFVLIKKLK